MRLRDRLQIARESEGELFLSLHADSLVKAPDVRGASVYTLSEQASNEEAARLASKENRADILAGIDLSNQEDIVTEILIDLAQRDANNKSIAARRTARRPSCRSVTKMARQRRSQAGFVVLKSPDMPSVLIELGYLSNAADEQALRDPAPSREAGRGDGRRDRSAISPPSGRDRRLTAAGGRSIAIARGCALRKVMKLLVALVASLLILAIVGAGGALYVLHRYGSDLPDYRQLADYQPPTVTRIHAGDGRLMAEYAHEKRIFVPVEAIPKRLIQAFLAAEDKNFYSHPGIDPLSVAARGR